MRSPQDPTGCELPCSQRHWSQASCCQLQKTQLRWPTSSDWPNHPKCSRRPLSTWSTIKMMRSWPRVLCLSWRNYWMMKTRCGTHLQCWQSFLSFGASLYILFHWNVSCFMQLVTNSQAKNVLKSRGSCHCTIDQSYIPHYKVPLFSHASTPAAYRAMRLIHVFFKWFPQSPPPG